MAGGGADGKMQLAIGTSSAESNRVAGADGNAAGAAAEPGPCNGTISKGVAEPLGDDPEIPEYGEATEVTEVLEPLRRGVSALSGEMGNAWPPTAVGATPAAAIRPGIMAHSNSGQLRDHARERASRSKKAAAKMVGES